MDEVEKWTRHFKLMAAGKLHKDPKGYYIVNQTPDTQTGGTEVVPNHKTKELLVNTPNENKDDVSPLKLNNGSKRQKIVHKKPTTRKRPVPPGIPNNRKFQKFDI